MSESKIELTIGSFGFSCEGEAQWVDSQLTKVLARLPELLGHEVITPLAASETIAEPSAVADTEAASDDETVVAASAPRRKTRKPRASKVVQEESTDPLLDYLKEKNAAKNQVRKFLATAVYLQAQGQERLSTPTVSKKLKAAGIEKLANASDCLNKNVKKGFAIKENKEFVITELGMKAVIGEEE